MCLWVIPMAFERVAVFGGGLLKAAFLFLPVSPPLCLISGAFSLPPRLMVIYYLRLRW